MAPTHCETVRPLMPWRMTSRAKAIVQRVMAKPDRATCDPEGMDATASVNVVSLVIGDLLVEDRALVEQDQQQLAGAVFQS